MRLKIYHQTKYQYASKVEQNENELRLTPKTNRQQYVESSFVYTYPAVKIEHYDDLNFNRVHRFFISHPHQELTIESRSIVQTQQKIKYEQLPYGFTHNRLKSVWGLEETHSYLQNSTFVEVNPDIWKEAIQIKDQSNDVFQTAYAVMEFIYENYNYTSGSTTVSTHANEIIQKREGVCQDFAHAMVAFCRSIKIPARYVSGYFYDSLCNNTLRGAQASHAWVEIFLGDHGWVGLDPTNRKVVDETYVVLAVGRDYYDVAPVSGSFFGDAGCHLNINVQVEAI
jgi:transglutaminase-like putative cysteine protease